MLGEIYCEKCNTCECDVLKGFLIKYNSFSSKKYRLIECPDKKNEKENGRKPDFLIKDDINEEILVVEHKKVFHSYGRGKVGQKRIAEDNIRNILYSYLSYILPSIIEQYEITKNLIVEIAIFKNTREKYIEEEFIPKVYDDLKEKIINNQSYLYEDDILKVEIKENFLKLSKEQIQFMFPTNNYRGNTEKGITLDEFFKRSLDYNGLIKEIDNTILKKCKGKFEKYSDYKRIILLELIFRYGDEIVVEVNKLNPNNGFSFEKLKKLFINNYNVDNYDFVDEIIIYYASDDTKKIVKLK